VAKENPSKQTRFFDNRPAVIVVIILVSVFFRALFMFLFSKSLFWEGIWSDSATYNQWARRIVVNNDWIGADPFFMTPFYPYFLAIVYSVFGQSLVAVRAIQSVVGVATVLFVFLIGEKIFVSRKAGFIAAILAAMYGPFLLSNNLLLVETMKVFFLALTFWILLIAREGRSLWLWFAAGVTLGCCVLCRPSDIIVLGVVIVWVLMFPVNRRNKPVFQSGACVAGVILMIVPVTIRNYLVSGEFILLTSNGGLNFYLGNNPDAVGVYYNVDELDLANDPDGRVFLESTMNKTLRPSEVSSEWSSRALDFIVSQPGDFLTLLGRKALLFFHHKEISQLGYNYYFVQQTAIPMLGYLPTFALVGPLGILGCMLLRKRWKEFFLLYGFLFAEIAGVVLFFVTDRFRLSAIPFLMLFAGFAVAELPTLLKEPGRRQLPLLATVLIAAVLVMTVFNYHLPDEFSIEWGYVGLMHFAKQNYGGALAAYHEAARYRDSFYNRNNIGNVYVAQGRIDEALEQFRIGHAMNPRQAISMFSIGTAYVSKQDWVSALDAFDKAIQINPRFPAAYLNKGLTLYFMQRFGEALASLRRYTEMERDKSKLASVYGDIRNLERLIQSLDSQNQPR
jgi:4-amino-4-deoxy-L-arabinose transferase-like glycosyltransferase